MDRIPPVKAVMTPFPHSIEPGAPLRQARHQMLQMEIRHLPVKRGQQLVGVLTDRDLKRALDPAMGLPPKDELFVEDVMVHEPLCVDLEEPLDRVLARMAEHHIGCVLVTKEERLAGIFTTTDACRVFAEDLARRFRPGGGDAA